MVHIRSGPVVQLSKCRKHERPCRYRVTTLLWKRNTYYTFLCVCVALIIQHAKRRHIVFCDLWLHHIFRHYLINGKIFGEKLRNIKCVFWLSMQLLFDTFLILRRIQGATVIKVKTFHVRYPLFLLDVNETWIFSTDFRKIKLKYQVSSKSIQWEPSCFMRTDITKRSLSARVSVGSRLNIAVSVLGGAGENHWARSQNWEKRQFPSSRPSAWSNSALTKRISIKFDI